MEKGLLLEVMEGCMWEIIKTIKNKGLECLLGRMEGCMKENGLMANNTEKELTRLHKG